MKIRSFAISKDEAFEACIKALRELNWEIKSQHFEMGQIEATVDSNLFSYGNIVSIIISTTKTIETSVKVTSGSVGIQLIDWGTNSEVEEQFINAVAGVLK